MKNFIKGLAYIFSVIIIFNFGVLAYLLLFPPEGNFSVKFDSGMTYLNGENVGFDFVSNFKFLLLLAAVYAYTETRKMLKKAVTD